jgi:anti-anti-sigma regulatory factor
MQLQDTQQVINQSPGLDGDAAGADLQLASILDMRAVRGLKSSLDQLYAKGGSCIVDGEQVVRLSTGCIQLLTAFLQAMADAKFAVTLRRPSAALLEGFEQLGLSPSLALCTLES